MSTNYSFWDAEFTDDAPPVGEMHVAAASVSDVQEFARRYHYSGHASNQSWRYGLWHGLTLWGVAGFNLPTRETCESVFGEGHHDRVAHLSRLALADHALPNSESFLISHSLRLLSRDLPHLWAVITYADILEGHLGYVYQATNAIYTGVGSSSHHRYVTQDGKVRGDYEGSRFISAQEAKERGWSVVKGLGKHRYVYILGTPRQKRERRAQLRLPSLPYPKSEAA